MKATSKRRLGIAMWIAPIFIIGLMSVAVTMAPKQFKESAKVRIHVHPDSGLPRDATMMARYMESERVSIVSESILSVVLENLNDHNVWYINGDNRLPKRIALLRLSRQTSATYLHGSLDIIEISVLWDTPQDAAEIANHIADTYILSLQDSATRSSATIIQRAAPLAGTRHPAVNELRSYYIIAGTISLIGFILFMTTPKTSNKRMEATRDTRAGDFDDD